MPLTIKNMKDYSSNASTRTRVADILLPLSAVMFISGLVVYVLERYQQISLDYLKKTAPYADDALQIIWAVFTAVMFYYFLTMLIRKRKTGLVQASRNEEGLAEFRQQIASLAAEEYALLLHCYQRNFQIFEITSTKKATQTLLQQSISGLLAKGVITHHPQAEKTYQIAQDLAKTRSDILDAQKDFDGEVIDAVSDIFGEALKKYKG